MNPLLQVIDSGHVTHQRPFLQDARSFARGAHDPVAHVDGAAWLLNVCQNLVIGRRWLLRLQQSCV
jgi:hypothetical protein